MTAKTRQDIDIAGQSVVIPISQCEWAVGHQLQIPPSQQYGCMGCAWLCFQEQRVVAGHRIMAVLQLRCQNEWVASN